MEDVVFIKKKNIRFALIIFYLKQNKKVDKRQYFTHGVDKFLDISV